MGAIGKLVGPAHQRDINIGVERLDLYYEFREIQILLTPLAALSLNTCLIACNTLPGAIRSRQRHRARSVQRHGSDGTITLLIFPVAAVPLSVFARKMRNASRQGQKQMAAAETCFIRFYDIEAL